MKHLAIGVLLCAGPATAQDHGHEAQPHARFEAIEAIHEAMRAEAIAMGAELIAAQRALSDAFAAGDVTPEALRSHLAASEAARGALRFIHLSRHIETVPLLTAQQIAQYNVLRGYADDPCASVPEGHDPEMWRIHNGCDG